MNLIQSDFESKTSFNDKLIHICLFMFCFRRFVFVVWLLCFVGLVMFVFFVLLLGFCLCVCVFLCVFFYRPLLSFNNILTKGLL